MHVWAVAGPHWPERDSRARLKWGWKTHCIFSEEFVIRLLVKALDNLFTLQGQLSVMQEGSTSCNIAFPHPFCKWEQDQQD